MHQAVLVTENLCIQNIHRAGVDLEDDQCSTPILQTLGQQKVHLLMVVAGLQHYDTWSTVNRQQVRQQLEVNAIGPLFLVQALQDNLAENAKVVIQAPADFARVHSVSR